MDMNYLKTFEQVMSEEPTVVSGPPAEGPKKPEVPKSAPRGLSEVKWTPEMQGNADYKLIFNSPSGEEVTGTFKDTGNRRFPAGDTIFAAFICIGSSNNTPYVAEAEMVKVGPGEYAIKSFVVQEN